MRLAALLGLAADLFALFLAAEGLLYLYPHPWHWLAASAGLSWAVGQG